MSELICILPEILDKRSEERMAKIVSKRLVIFHKNPQYKEALELASWELNHAGMKTFQEAMDMCDKKVS